MNDLFGTEKFEQQYEVNTHSLAGIEIKIREFTFHRLNGNQVWPGNQIFAEFLERNREFLQHKRILELGSGSGILAIFLAKLGMNVTASDCPDAEIFENIEYNCNLNEIQPVPTFPRKKYFRYVGRSYRR